MDSPLVDLFLGLIVLLLGVIVAGGWNLIGFVKGQLADNIKEHKLFYNNVLHHHETSVIVARHTTEIKDLDEKTDGLEKKVNVHEGEINNLKKYKYKKIS